MKVLVITQYFYPENFRINELCKELKRNGHIVTVLTGKPNYPIGKFYEGYTFFGKDDEVWDDMPIIRSPMLPRGKGSFRLILNYFSFAFFCSQKAKQIEDKDFDIIYVFEVSPITVAYPAITFKKKNKTPIIMNVQDLWPENIVAITGLKAKPIIYFLDKMVNNIYKHCDIILVASRSFLPSIENRVKETAKVKYWPQFSIVERMETFETKFDSNYFNIVFTGNIGDAQNLELVIEAANILKNENLRWHFVGEGRSKEKLMKLVRGLDLEEKVIFYGFIEEKYIPLYLQSADVALLTLKPDSIFDCTIPAKLQTYLACGSPIIGCVKGESSRIIQESKAGLVCDDISAKGLVDCVLQFLSMDTSDMKVFKENCISYSSMNFDKRKLINELEEYMAKMKEGVK